ncbi:bifunctional folylpolyglutamate synthase/dihydrofolate synthase, partial [bacterium]|nr:bifunctional folylpolyglutamate synthase/dihydrofolate synthase [bacterium]
MIYQEALNYLYNLEGKGQKFRLANIRALLRLLGNPHHLLKAIHIGGTNGKGSTAAFISSILQAGGYKVGLYTSPHLW